MYHKENTMKKTERAKQLKRAIELTWDSLDSHLGYINDEVKACSVKSHKKELGDKKFHRKCVREYAEILLTLSRELEEL